MALTSQFSERDPLLLLEDDRARWSVCENAGDGGPVVYARGYAHDGSQSFENDSLAKHVCSIAANGSAALRAAIPHLNGGWALVVVWSDGRVLAAVDRMRCVPLFFYHNKGQFAIAACAASLAKRFSPSLDTRGQLKFLLFGYVSGSGTLFENVRQIQPGEIVEFDARADQPLQTTQYYRFYAGGEASGDQSHLSEDLAGVLRRMFERFRDGYQEEQIAIPLSGGLDSRLVAGMLRRMGIENCLCYTYGDESSEEVRISRQVAEALSYPWRRLDYTPTVLSKFGTAQAFREYWLFGSKSVSAPHAQDFAAVLQLSAEGFGGPETIYFPGHSADMNAGSHIPADYADLYSGKLSVVEEIIRHHSRPTWYESEYLLRSPAGQGIVSEIEKEAAPLDATLNCDPLARCEMWNAENRQAKYIINSVRIYEFFGARWRTLWDYEFMDFFLRVPTEQRYGQRLYLECLRSEIFVDDLAPLADIPITKYGSLTSLKSVRAPARRSSLIGNSRNALKRAARWQSLKFGLGNPIADKEDPLIRTIIGWCGMEDATTSITFGEALERAGALVRLEPEVRGALAPWLKMRVDSVPGFAVYTTLMLAEMSRK